MKVNPLIRSHIYNFNPYSIDEQSTDKKVIRLNTNENPYPPSSKVLSQIKKATGKQLRLYPDPYATNLRKKLAALHNVSIQNIVVGNGIDELIGLAIRTFVDPGKLVQHFIPSYSFYSVAAQIHNAAVNEIPLDPSFSYPSPDNLINHTTWKTDAALTILTHPDSPTGYWHPLGHTQQICNMQTGVVLIDEAYIEFTNCNTTLALTSQYPHVLTARTFSKAYSLCSQRVGYLIGNAELINAIHKIRDCNNVNYLGQIAAEATLDNLPYYEKNIKRIVETRNQTSLELIELKCEVVPSHANFLLVRLPVGCALVWREYLRNTNILVRWLDTPLTRDYLRITIGTPKQMKAVIQAIRSY